MLRKWHLKLRFIGLIALVSSVVSLVFLIRKIRLNKYIKTVLIIMMIMNIICSMIGMVGGLFPASELECRLSLNAWSVMEGTLFMNSLISFLRWYLSYLASKAKMAQTFEIVVIIATGTVFSYGSSPISTNLADFFGYETFWQICKETPDENYTRSLFVSGPIMSIVAFGIGIGLYFNIKLYNFVKKRSVHKSQTPGIIPWKLGNENSEEDLQVPLRATILTTVVSIVILGSFSVILGNALAQENINWVDLKESLNWVFLFHIPMTASLPGVIMLFVVKQQAKIKASQPPQELQFHEQELEIEIVLEGFVTQWYNFPIY